MSQQGIFKVSIDDRLVWDPVYGTLRRVRRTRAARYDALVTRPTDDERSAFGSMAGALNQGDWQGVR